MIDPGRSIVYGLDRLDVRESRPAQHDHRQAENARRRDLAVGRRAAAVLCHDDIDAMVVQEPALIGFVERTTAGHINGMRHGERRDHRVDAAHHIVMLRGVDKGRDLLAAEGNEDTARCVAERPYDSRNVVDFDPAIPRNRDPAGSTQGQQLNSRPPGGVPCVRRNYGRIRMGRIDEHIDFLVNEIIRQAFGAAETADPHRNRLQRRSSRAARERQRHCQVDPLGQPFGEPTRFRGAAENEDSHAAC